MLGMRILIFTMIATLVLGAGCRNKSDIAEGADSEVSDEETAEREDFDLAVEGTPPPATLTVCRYSFKVELADGEAEDETLDACALVFALSEDMAGVRSCKLTAPDGRSGSYAPPTVKEPTIDASDLTGEDAEVEGSWLLEFDARTACDVITSVELAVAGSYAP